jgi:hypothetical protein
MSRLEMAIVRVALVTLISVTVFYIFWISGFLLFGPGAEGYIKWTALIGLALGVVAGLLLQTWLAPLFYLLPASLSVVGYLVLLVFGIGLGMGVPVGIPVLGVLVGLYLARRAALLGSSGPSFLLRLHCTMVWTVGASFAILAALWSVTAARAARGLETGVPDFMGNRALSHVMFLIGVVLLAPALQGLLTELAGRLAFARWRLGQHHYTSPIGS